MQMSDTKICYHCNEEKPNDQFKPLNKICNYCTAKAGTLNIAKPLTNNEKALQEQFLKNRENNMHKVKEPDVDGKPTTFVVENYENEARDLFEKADIEAGEDVYYLETIDSIDEETILLERKDWIE